MIDWRALNRALEARRLALEAAMDADPRDTTSSSVPVPSDADKVDDWRETVLGEAGYPPALAWQLARDRDVDLHTAVYLLEAGCAVALALDILI